VPEVPSGGNIMEYALLKPFASQEEPGRHNADRQSSHIGDLAVPRNELIPENRVLYDLLE
jgi:hypothetical protein